MSQGWVYIFSNPGLPKIVKVGFTLKHPRDRAKELSHSGVPRPYVIEYAVRVDDPQELEKRVHQYLTIERLNDGKEWFRCSADHAIAVLKAHSQQIHQELTTKGAGNTEAIAAEEQVVRDRLREQEEEEKRKQQAVQAEMRQREEEEKQKQRKLEEQKRVRQIERDIEACFKTLADREAEACRKLVAARQEVFHPTVPKPSFGKLYVGICVTLGGASLLVFQEPGLLVPILLFFGPILAGMAYGYRIPIFRAKHEAASHVRQETQVRLLTPITQRFPPRPDPAGQYTYQKIHYGRDPFFMTPFPPAYKQQLTGKASFRDGRVRGELINQTDWWVVTFVELAVKLDAEEAVPVKLPLCVLPGETETFEKDSIAGLLGKKPTKWSWSIRGAYGYEIADREEE